MQWCAWFGLVPCRLPVKRQNICSHVQYVAFTQRGWSCGPVSVYLSTAGMQFRCLIVWCYGRALWLPAGAACSRPNPINPLSCRSITSTELPQTGAAAAPTLARLVARLHPAFTRGCYLRMSPIDAPNDAPLPPPTHLYLLASNGSWVGALAPRSHTTHHTHYTP